jgi:hypothetical protein
MTDAEFDMFLASSLEQLASLNQRCEQEFNLGHLEEWSVDLEKGVLEFSNVSGLRVVATVRVVGTTSDKSNTFRWGWANEHLPSVAVEGMSSLREFGEREGIEVLTWDTLEDPDDIDVGWEMTAIAVRVLKAKGSYRCPETNGYIYLLITELTFVA